MPEGEPSRRRFEAAITMRVLFSHGGTDEEVKAYVKDLGGNASDGMWSQDPDLHGVERTLELHEMVEGREIEIE